MFGDQPTTVMVRFAGDARDGVETVRRLQQEVHWLSLRPSRIQDRTAEVLEHLHQCVEHGCQCSKYVVRV